MKGPKRECTEAEAQEPRQRRRRVQFAPEAKIHDAGVAEEGSAGGLPTEAPMGDLPGGSPPPAGDPEGPSDVDMLESRFTKEAVEDLRRRKKALAAGVNRLGLGLRPADFDISDSAAAANAAGEADPDEADAGEVPLEPFNMRREMQEGAFDNEGTYVWRKTNPDEVRDPWLDSLGDAKAINVSEAVRQRCAAQTDGPADSEISVNVVESLRKIIQVLNPTETPSRALRRLAEGGPRRGQPMETPTGAAASAAPKGRGRKNRMLPALAAAAERDAAEAAAAAAEQEAKGEENGNAEDKQKTFDSLTEICTALLATGRNVYFLTKAQLEGMLQKETSASSAGYSPSGDSSNCQEAETVLWQFRWTNNPQDKEIHGPYDSSTFRSWIQANFISDTNPVEVRRVSAANDPLDGVWLPWRSADFRSDEQERRDIDLQEETEAQWEAEEDARLAEETRGNEADDDDIE